MASAATCEDKLAPPARLKMRWRFKRRDAEAKDAPSHPYVPIMHFQAPNGTRLKQTQAREQERLLWTRAPVLPGRAGGFRRSRVCFPSRLWPQSDVNQRKPMSHFLFMAPTRSRFPLVLRCCHLLFQSIEQVSASCCPPPRPHFGAILIKQNMFRVQRDATQRRAVARAQRKAKKRAFLFVLMALAGAQAGDAAFRDAATAERRRGAR